MGNIAVLSETCLLLAAVALLREHVENLRSAAWERDDFVRWMTEACG